MRKNGPPPLNQSISRSYALTMTSDRPDQADLIDIGRVRRAVGLDGRVEVEVYSGDPARLAPGSRVFANGEPITVKSSQPGGRGGVIVVFEGAEDRDGSERLRGVELQVPQSELPPPAEGSYYHFEIIGCEVRDTAGAFIGLVTGIMETGSNDVFIIEASDGKEILAPVIKAVVTNIDKGSRLITIDPPDGLIS
jgi:16S rRNA processing protein RimM